MKRILILSIPICLIVFLSWYVFFNNQSKLKTLDKETTVTEVQNDLRTIKKQEEEILKWVPDAEIGHIKGESEDKYSNHEGLVKYLFAALKLKDENMFLEVFVPETISKDLFKEENPDKASVVKGWIQEMTRDGQLDNIGYAVKKGSFGSDLNEMVLYFMFTDGVQVAVPIELEESVHYHGEKEERMVMISNSIYSILDELKKH